MSHILKCRCSRNQIIYLSIITIVTIVSVTSAALYYFQHEHHDHGIPKSSIIAELYHHAAVVTDNIRCAEIGRDILERNGSAVDAGIAASFCLNLFSMHSAGIGGGGFMLVYKRDTKTVELFDYRETAPGKSWEEMLQDKSATGGLNIAVPGEVKGLHAAYRKHGKLEWRKLIEPSIGYAKSGFPMTLRMHEVAKQEQNSLEKDPGLRKVLFQNGKLIGLGEKIFNKALASTFEKIALDPESFYTGSLAQDIIRDVQNAGGIMTLDDLHNYVVKQRKVLVDELNGLRLYTTSLPSGGPILTHVLNILKGFHFKPIDLKGTNTTITTYHRIIEALKFGYAQKEHCGDPDFLQKEEVEKCIANMTSAEYESSYRMKITDNATHNLSYYGVEVTSPDDRGTSQISVYAPNGDAVSMTTSINSWYGANLLSLNTGIIYNNQMDDFNRPRDYHSFGLLPNSKNFIKPNKRPISSMAPVILTDKNGDVRLVIGASGGSKIIASVAQGLMYMNWFGCDLAEAINRARLYYQLVPNMIVYEPARSLPQSVLDGLVKKGHKIAKVKNISALQAIYINGTETVYAKSDPRTYGHSAGF